MLVQIHMEAYFYGSPFPPQEKYKIQIKIKPLRQKCFFIFDSMVEKNNRKQQQQKKHNCKM